MTSAVPLGRSGAERELSHVTDDSKNNAFSMKLQEKLWTLKLIALVVGNQVCMFGECAVSEDMEACPWGSPTPHPWVSSFDWSSFVSFMKKKKVIVGTSLSCVLGVILVNHQTWGNGRGPESVARWSEVQVGTSLVVQ